MHPSSREYYKKRGREGYFNIEYELHDMLLDITPNNINTGVRQTARIGKPADPLANYSYVPKARRQSSGPAGKEKAPRKAKSTKQKQIIIPELLQCEYVELMERIAGAVCEVLDISNKHLKTRSREMHFVTPRWITWMFMRDAGLSYRYIRYYFGGYDHTTIQYAVEQLRKQAGKDSHLSAQISQILKKLGNDNTGNR